MPGLPLANLPAIPNMYALCGVWILCSQAEYEVAVLVRYNHPTNRGVLTKENLSCVPSFQRSRPRASYFPPTLSPNQIRRAGSTRPRPGQPALSSVICQNQSCKVTGTRSQLVLYQKPFTFARDQSFSTKSRRFSFVCLNYVP